MTGQHPAVDAALDWLRLVLVEKDIAAAWPRTAANLRLCLAQLLLFENPEVVERAFGKDAQKGRELLAERLSLERLLAGDWPVLQQWMSGFLAGSPPGPCIPLPTQVVDHDVVRVEFLAGGRTSLAPGEYAPGACFLMRSQGQRWLVASLSKRLPQPGWPPILR